MCSPIADGAAAAILVSEDVAKSPGRANVVVRASRIVSANQDGADPVCAVRAGQQAYEQAGLGGGRSCRRGPRRIGGGRTHSVKTALRANRGAELLRRGVTAPRLGDVFRSIRVSQFCSVEAILSVRPVSRRSSN